MIFVEFKNKIGEVRKVINLEEVQGISAGADYVAVFFKSGSSEGKKFVFPHLKPEEVSKLMNQFSTLLKPATVIAHITETEKIDKVL